MTTEEYDQSFNLFGGFIALAIRQNAPEFMFELECFQRAKLFLCHFMEDWESVLDVFNTSFNELCIHGLNIGHYYKLIYGCCITHVESCGKFWVCLFPFFCGVSEHREIQHVSLICIKKLLLSLGYAWVWNYKQLFDGIGMKVVVRLCQQTVQIPFKCKRITLSFFKPLEFLDYIQMKGWAKPHAKMKGNILVCICPSSISPCSGFYSNCISAFHPVFYADSISSATRLISNYGEFTIIKIGIIESFPCAEIIQSVSVSYPVRYIEFSLFVLGHIGKTDEIFIIVSKQDRNFMPLNIDLLLAHAFIKTSAPGSVRNKVTLCEPTSEAELKVFRESVTNHIAQR